MLLGLESRTKLNWNAKLWNRLKTDIISKTIDFTFEI